MGSISFFIILNLVRHEHEMPLIDVFFNFSMQSFIELTFTLRPRFPCLAACQLWLFLGKHDYSPVIPTFKQAIRAIHQTVAQSRIQILNLSDGRGNFQI